MLASVPAFVVWEFCIVTLLTFYCFVKIAKTTPRIFILFLLWIIAQSVLAYIGFYLDTDRTPPLFILTILPPLFLIGYVFLSKKTTNFIRQIDYKKLTLLHSIRIPVELILYQLFIYNAIPELMTFSGRNFDILAGITAPIIYYLGYHKNLLNSKIRIAWNVASLLLLINIIVYALLSAPFSFQKFAFDQPNVALIHFPFALLPAFIVPVVIFTHLIAIKREFET